MNAYVHERERESVRQSEACLDSEASRDQAVQSHVHLYVGL